MLFLRKFFAGIFFSLSVGLFLPFLVTFLVLQTYVSPDFLKGAFLEDSYAKIDIVFQQVELPGGQDKEAFVLNLKKIFPKERYQLLGNAFLDSFFEGFQNFQPGNPLKISLEGVKLSALTEIKKFSAQMAPCQKGEHVDKDLCVPSEYSSTQQELFRDEITKQFSNELKARIPSSFSFQENEKFPWLQYTSVLLRFRTAIILGMVGILLVLLVLMDLLMWRPASRSIRWNASVFLLFSLESFGLFFLFSKIPELLLKVEPIKPHILELIRWLLSYFVWYSVAGGILFGVLSVVSFGASFFLSHEHPKKV